MRELTLGLTEYFMYYNQERPHQSLAYRTPEQIYASGQGGGAAIPDHFTKKSAGQGIHNGAAPSSCV